MARRARRTPASGPRRIVALALVILWLGMSGTVAAAEMDRARMFAVSPGVLKVEVSSADGHYGLGTAVSIAPGKFVTNCHVTRKAQVIAVLHDGRRWPVAAQLSDIEDDLCLLDVPELKDVAPVPLGRAQDLRVGHPVAALGYPGGLGLQAQAGSVQALHPLHGSVVIQTTTAFFGGASGGGLFNEDGQLVGILTFRLPGADAYYFATPLDWIRPRIGASNAYVKVAPLTGPVAYWARQPADLPYFMQAASLEAGKDWDALLALTGKWAAAERDNSEPWFERGEACEHLSRDADAVSAYQTAVKLDPKSAVAWSSLGELQLRLGNRKELEKALTALKELDASRAAELSEKGGALR